MFLSCTKNEHALSKIPSMDAAGATYKLDSYANGIPCNNPAAGALVVTTTPSFANQQRGGLSVGQNIVITSTETTTGGGGPGVTYNRVITTIGIVGNKLQIGFAGGVTMATHVKVSLPVSNTVQYKLKNMELKLLEVIPPQNLLKQVIKESQFDFISYETFRGNLPSSSLSHQEDIPSVATKGKCLITHYTDTTTENDPFTPNYYRGISPLELGLDSVQYFIQNKLYPLRAYNPGHFEDKIVSLNELNKSMRTLGKVVKSFGDSGRGGITDYSYTYLTSRELARGQDFVYNLKDSEAQIRLGFKAVRANNVKLETFCFSVRSIMISENNLSLVL